MPSFAARISFARSYHHSSSSSSSSDHHSFPIGAYIGIAVFIVVLIIVFAWVLYRKRRSEHVHFEEHEPDEHPAAAAAAAAYQTYAPAGAGATTQTGGGEMRYVQQHVLGGSTQAPPSAQGMPVPTLEGRPLEATSYPLEKDPNGPPDEVQSQHASGSNTASPAATPPDDGPPPAYR